MRFPGHQLPGQIRPATFKSLSTWYVSSNQFVNGNRHRAAFQMRWSSYVSSLQVDGPGFLPQEMTAGWRECESQAGKSPELQR